MLKNDVHNRITHLPFVMRLVYGAVDGRMVEAAVDPVDERVREHDKRDGGYRQPGVPRPRVHGVVEAAVAAHLQQEETHGGDGHKRDHAARVRDLQPHLVLQATNRVDYNTHLSTL